MKRKRHSPEEIIRKLRQADAERADMAAGVVEVQVIAGVQSAAGRPAAGLGLMDGQQPAHAGQAL